MTVLLALRNQAKSSKTRAHVTIRLCVQSRGPFGISSLCGQWSHTRSSNLNIFMTSYEACLHNRRFRGYFDRRGRVVFQVDKGTGYHALQIVGIIEVIRIHTEESVVWTNR